MSTRQIKPYGVAPTQEVVLIDGSGNLLGTAAAPLQTATSNLQTVADLTKTIMPPIVVAGTNTIVAAAASNRGRIYRLRLDVAGANVVTITDATGAEKMNFTGAGFKILDFATRAWYTSAVNTALTITTTTTAEVNVTAEWTRVP